MRIISKKLVRLYDTCRGQSNAYYHAYSLIIDKLDQYDDHKSSMKIDASSMTNLYRKNSTFVPMTIFSRQLKCATTPTLHKYQSIRFKSDTPKNDSKEEEKSRTLSNPLSDEDKKSKLSLVGLVRKYGWTFFGTYMSIYVTTLVSLYISLDAGYLDPSTIANIDLPWHAPSGNDAQDADVRELKTTAEFVGSYLEKFSWTKTYAPLVMNNPRTTNLALAWIATKLTEPIRLAATLAILPSVSRFVREKTSATKQHDHIKEREKDGASKH